MHRSARVCKSRDVRARQCVISYLRHGTRISVGRAKRRAATAYRVIGHPAPADGSTAWHKAIVDALRRALECSVEPSPDCRSGCGLGRIRCVYAARPEGDPGSRSRELQRRRSIFRCPVGRETATREAFDRRSTSSDVARSCPAPAVSLYLTNVRGRRFSGAARDRRPRRNEFKPEKNGGRTGAQGRLRKVARAAGRSGEAPRRVQSCRSTKP